ncbi:MAG: TIM-barrel domain-containing protein [Microthrixaceae bacterium]
MSAVIVQPDPVADVGQIVVAGNVRVSVLTDRLLRVEYSPDAAFEDRSSLSVVNRRFPKATYAASLDGSSLTVRTSELALNISDITRSFSSRSLTAERTSDGARWHFGKVDRSNLGGTVRTLDNWDGNRLSRYAGWDDETGIQLDWEEQDLEPGLLSRSGWSVFDDSGSVVLDPRSGGRAARGRSWPTAREPGERIDIYLFAYGDSHVEALQAASRLFGPQPLPPRFTFGYWYSRYYPYTDAELLSVTDELDHFGIPADVLVIDMDWHRLGWTGYSWDKDLFPDPTATLQAVHDRGLKVCLNLHPADGVGSHEDAFEAMCDAMGLDPGETDRIPFDITDPNFVDAYLRLLHHPEEDRGVDFWWMDWQQGMDTQLSGLDPLAWLNHIHWDDASRRRPTRRPLIFSRWDGLGAGRHPIGFSGDTYATWESLGFQPGFTATAANVLYGYWSHDIGGHIGSTPDPEMYARWLQFGAHSPMLRTHGTLDPLAERKVWEFPNPYRAIMIDTIRRRYELIPYIYGECRRGLDDGRSLVRPMYHEHPESECAYDLPGQYYFGADMIVAPVVEPIGEDSMGAVSVWLPEGEWFDTAHGGTLSIKSPSGESFKRRYLLSETPAFVARWFCYPDTAGRRQTRQHKL